MKIGDICKNGHVLTINNMTTPKKNGHSLCKICTKENLRLAKIAAKKREETANKYFLDLVKNDSDDYLSNRYKRKKGI